MDTIARGLAQKALSEIAGIEIGEPVELRRTSTNLEWRRIGQPTWTLLVPLAETGDALEFDWNGTSLGVKRRSEVDFTYTDLIGPVGLTGPQGLSLEFHWNGTQLGIRLEGEPTYQYVNLVGPQGIQGPIGLTGPQGLSLEYQWSGTQLGIRVEGDTNYTYVDLRGPQGIQGEPGDAADISAGDGIDITNDEVSVDATVARRGTAQTFTGQQEFSDGINFRHAVETVAALGNSGTSHSLPLNTGSIFQLTLTANCTITFGSIPPGAQGKSFVLKLTHSGAARSVTWPASVRWDSGEAPELGDTAGSIDILTFISDDAGTTWYGFLGGSNFA